MAIDVKEVLGLTPAGRRVLEALQGENGKMPSEYFGLFLECLLPIYLFSIEAPVSPRTGFPLQKDLMSLAADISLAYPGTPRSFWFNDLTGHGVLTFFLGSLKDNGFGLFLGTRENDGIPTHVYNKV